LGNFETHSIFAITPSHPQNSAVSAITLPSRCHHIAGSAVTTPDALDWVPEHLKSIEQIANFCHALDGRRQSWTAIKA